MADHGGEAGVVGALDERLEAPGGSWEIDVHDREY
jgi:hypothetical protein